MTKLLKKLIMARRKLDEYFSPTKTKYFFRRRFDKVVSENYKVAMDFYISKAEKSRNDAE